MSALPRIDRSIIERIGLKQIFSRFARLDISNLTTYQILWNAILSLSWVRGRNRPWWAQSQIPRLEYINTSHAKSRRAKCLSRDRLPIAVQISHLTSGACLWGAIVSLCCFRFQRIYTSSENGWFGPIFIPIYCILFPSFGPCGLTSKP